MSIDDIIDILAIDLIGVVPDDEKIIVSTNKESQRLQTINPQPERLTEHYKKNNGRGFPLLNLGSEDGFMFKIKSCLG